MQRPKFSIDEEEVEKSSKPSVIVKYEEGSFWGKLTSMFPSPEEELETMKEDQIKLRNLIEETKEVLEKIDKALENHPSSRNDDEALKEEFSKLIQKQEYYTNMLETFEAELSCTKAQEKSLDKILNDSEDEDFQEDIPELIANSIVTSRKKMEDVNSVVSSIEKSIKRNRIEECIVCEVNIKDDKGRKSSIRHIHLSGFESLKKYKPVLCIDCFDRLKQEGKIEEFQLIEIPETFEKDTEFVCKKGSKIFSIELEINNPELFEKAKKLIDLESKEFIESIKVEEKTSLFNFKF